MKKQDDLEQILLGSWIEYLAKRMRRYVSPVSLSASQIHDHLLNRNIPTEDIAALKSIETDLMRIFEELGSLGEKAKTSNANTINAEECQRLFDDCFVSWQSGLSLLIEITENSLMNYPAEDSTDILGLMHMLKGACKTQIQRAIEEIQPFANYFNPEFKRWLVENNKT